MLKKILKPIKENFLMIIFIIIFLFLVIFELPYSISKTGGVIDLSKRIKSENDFDETGSLNMSYVSEIRPTISNVIISLLHPDYDLERVEASKETKKELELRGKISLQESMNNAIKVAYDTANLTYLENNKKIVVTYLFEEANTNLKVGDEIKEINGVKVNTKKQLESELQKYQENDNIIITVNNNNESYIRNAKLLNINNKVIIGIVVSEISDLTLDPEITIQFKKTEYGSSGGLMMSLAIYDNLTGENITKGRNVAGTGTIDAEGNVGEISGVKYKLKGVVKNHMDIFLVPTENFEEAKTIKEKNNYDIVIVPINTFQEALEYLKK